MQVTLAFRGAPAPDAQQARLREALGTRFGTMPGQLSVELYGEGLAVTGVTVSAIRDTAEAHGLDELGAVYGALAEAGFAVLPVRPPHGPDVVWVDEHGAACDPPGDAPEWLNTIGEKVGRILRVVMRRSGDELWNCASARPRSGSPSAEDLDGFRRDVDEALFKAGRRVRL